MNQKTFKVFSEASSYAKELAQEIGCDVLMRRKTDGWEVFIERPSSTLAVQKRLSSLTEEQLMLKWKDRDTIDDWLVDILRNILREKIKPADGHSAQACRSCGQVGSNCTCERNWF
jgi:hypothetical protein